MPVAQHRPGQLREAQVEHPQYEQLVPEDVPPVGLAVQPPGRNARVEVGGVLGVGLQQVEQVEVERHGAVEVGLDPAAAPQFGPARGVGGGQLGEVGCLGGQPVDRPPRCSDGRVPRGGDGDGLLHGDRPAGSQLQGEQFGCPAGAQLGGPFDVQRRAVLVHPVADGQCDGQRRVLRDHLEPEHPVVGPALPVGAQVAAGQTPVAGDAGVGHGAVQR